MPKLTIPGEHLPTVWIDERELELAAHMAGAGVEARMLRSRMSHVEYFPASRLDEIGARLEAARQKILHLEGKLMAKVKRRHAPLGMTKIGRERGKGHT